jgi:hypothetical protein
VVIDEAHRLRNVYKTSAKIALAIKRMVAPIPKVLLTATPFQMLQERLRPYCKRTLRSQVQEYVKYTRRRAIVQEFVPSTLEKKLYDKVTKYLQSPLLYALPSSQ